MDDVRRGFRPLLAAAAVSLLGLLLFTEGASATVECRFDEATHVLSISTTGKGQEYAGKLKRFGDDIRLIGLFGPQILCGGSPKVTNTDLIEIRTKGLSGVDIELDGGPFAPGATPEADGSSEIEFVVAGTEDGIVSVQGASAPDHFRYTTAAGVSGVNLNPGPGDSDVDIEVPDVRKPGPVVIADGRKGNDTIDVVGRPPVLPFLVGGDGNDTLLARGALGAIIDGGSGRDQIVGSPGFDFLVPGGGPDKVNASGGPDEIEETRDGNRDQIDCGGGRDAVGKHDRFDSLRSCERTASGGRGD
jgi:Ca2+-binding RTX toxin-like protein